jgi:glycosyltransferase involved in cell wall biosynthesis
MSIKNPTVSVVIATRNRIDLLQRALKSVAVQDYVDYEALVLDDGSDEAVQRQYDSLMASLPANFTLHHLRPPGSAGAGPAAARNQGIRRATGEFVAFLDDDDHWIAPDHLSVAVDQLRRHDGDYFFANMQATRGGQVVMADWFSGSPILTSGDRLSDQPAVYDVSLRSFVRIMRSYLSHPDCWVVRRDLLNTVGGFWEQARFAEDYELMLRIADRARRILYRPHCVASYRLPEGNANSLAFTKLEETTQWLLCTIHLQAKCIRPAVRGCARARESWVLREVAQHLLTEGRPVAAIPFAWQGVCAFPTLGGAAFAARTIGRAVRQAILGR